MLALFRRYAHGDAANSASSLHYATVSLHLLLLDLQFGADLLHQHLDSSVWPRLGVRKRGAWRRPDPRSLAFAILYAPLPRLGIFDNSRRRFLAFRRNVRWSHHTEICWLCVRNFEAFRIETLPPMIVGLDVHQSQIIFRYAASKNVSGNLHARMQTIFFEHRFSGSKRFH